ncbi:MAG: sigma 54-interacting transcriptional regulator [Nannocystaceae bacterium]|nr:sigma 54-interacting transcriptional regulator [bacterium]
MNTTLHTQQIRSNDALAIRRNPLELEVVRGPDKKLAGTFTSDRIVVGVHESCDLVLSDPTVSRQHFEIELEPSGYRIRDLDSLNGLDVDGVRVFDARVGKSATLTVGETRIKMRMGSTAVELGVTSMTRCGPLRGRSVAMRRVFERIERVAPTPSTVLITGESGTGKELAARAIHELSPRADAPFVVVDCGALPPTLIESELYGHERGAFTGAARARKGAFEAAQGGTLFLDEIGELPLDLQTRLLGVIERRAVQPLGSSTMHEVDVRLVAATNRDLRREANRGTFRADLYFRLSVVGVHMPPLRERIDDLPVYVEAFIDEWEEQGLSLEISPETIAGLQTRRWPGNVRELRNVLERAAVLGDLEDPHEPPSAPTSQAPRVSAAIDPQIPFKTSKALLVADFERAYVEQLMARHAGNITRAARAAEIDRAYLLRLLDKFDMRPTKRGPKR